jgi:transposase
VVAISVLLAAQQVAAPPATMFLDIKGIGPEFAAILWSEGLLRHFDNRRQVASYAGLTPTPWQDGSIDREQGVSKAGNPRLRTTLIHLSCSFNPRATPGAMARHDRHLSLNGKALRAIPINARHHSSCVTLRLGFNLPQPGVSIICAAPQVG